jgi:AcrR family transcriptional regulator
MGNREALLEAAIVCLRDRGYGGTRARDLASTAGVSLGAIRYHFGSTEALLNEAIAESSRRWISGFQASMAAAADAAAGLEDTAADIYLTFEDNRALLTGFVEALAHARRSDAARDQLAGYYDEFRREIAAALQSTPDYASILIALVDGLMVQWLLAPDRCPPADLLKKAASALAELPTAP